MNPTPHRAVPRATIALTATAGLWALASALQPDVGITPADRYPHVLAHPSLEGIAGLVFMAVGVMFVVSAIAIVTAGVTGRGARAVTVGGLLIGVGATWMSVTYAKFDMVFLQLIQAGVPKKYVYTIIDGGAHPYEYWFDLALLGVLAGPIVLGTGLRLARRASWLPPVLWLVGVVAYASVEFSTVPGRVVAILVCTVALGMMGRGLDRLPVAAPVREHVAA